MWRLFTKCIFCEKDLPQIRIGDGEHVIPANIFGFWCSYDVCDACIKYFGSGVDKLTIANPQMLKSMHLLNINELEKKYEQMPYFAEDKKTKEKVLMIRRKGGFKPKVNKVSDDFLECSESDIEMVGTPYIKSQYRGMFSHEVLDKEINSLKEKYNGIAPGESVHSTLLGLTMRKRQVTNVKYDLERIPSITPLIAKIVFTAIHYFVPMDLVASFMNYGELRDHARYGKAISDFTVNSCILQKEDKRFPFHRLRFFGGGYSLLVDCTFFGFDNWRTILNCDKEVKLADGENREVETISFYMDFLQRENRKKFVEFIYPDGKKILLPADI